jgi:hypothetical protein
MANKWDNFHENMGDEQAALHMSGAFDSEVGHDHDPNLPGRGKQISYNSLKDKPTSIANVSESINNVPLSEIFEPDGTTVKNATHAESADNSNYKVVKNGFLNLTDDSPIIIVFDSVVVPLGYILIAKVLPQIISFPMGDTSKNIAKIARLAGSIWSHSELVSYGRFREEGVSFGQDYMSSGTYVNLQIEIYHHVTLALTYTDGTSGTDRLPFDAYYEIALVPAP